MAQAFSRTWGGILAPLRKPGMETFLATSESVLSYAAEVAEEGMWRVSSTALSGRRLREEDFLDSASAVDDRCRCVF